MWRRIPTYGFRRRHDDIEALLGRSQATATNRFIAGACSASPSLHGELVPVGFDVFSSRAVDTSGFASFKKQLRSKTWTISEPKQVIDRLATLG